LQSWLLLQSAEVRKLLRVQSWLQLRGAEAREKQMKTAKGSESSC